MATATQLMTAHDLERLPDDGMRHELVRGELQTMSPASSLHGKVAMNISFSLLQHVREHKLGDVYAAETGFIVASDPDTVRAPDVAFVRAERVQATGDVQGYWPSAPDLAIEVISPNDLYTEVDEKVEDYLQAGTGMVLLVNPRRSTVTVYRPDTPRRILSANDTIDGEDVVPGWRCPVRDVFL